MTPDAKPICFYCGRPLSRRNPLGIQPERHACKLLPCQNAHQRWREKRKRATVRRDRSVLSRLPLIFLLVLAVAAPAHADEAVPEGDTAEVIEQPVDEQPVAPVLGPTVPELITDAARRHGLDPQRPLRIAWCESRWGQDPDAYRWDRAHRGVFQFSGPTWREQAPLHGLPASFDFAFDDALNVELALALMARGQWSRWSCR